MLTLTVGSKAWPSPCKSLSPRVHVPSSGSPGRSWRNPPRPPAGKGPSQKEGWSTRTGPRLRPEGGGRQHGMVDGWEPRWVQPAMLHCTCSAGVGQSPPPVTCPSSLQPLKTTGRLGSFTCIQQCNEAAAAAQRRRKMARAQPARGAASLAACFAAADGSHQRSRIIRNDSRQLRVLLCCGGALGRRHGRRALAAAPAAVG